MKLVYVDSSVIVRRYLPTDAGHAAAVALFTNSDASTVRITSPLSRIEVSGALVRAARHAGVEPGPVLARFDADVAAANPLVVQPDAAVVDADALGLVRAHGLRALDALHIAIARTLLAALADPSDSTAFATGDQHQATAAAAEGLESA